MGAIETGTQIASSIAGWLGIGEKRQDRRQVEQQGKLNNVNAKTAKELADYEQALKMKMWNDTNYGAQLKQAEKAGVSKAAVLGGNGMGTGQGASVGSVGGGNAADAAATQQAATNQAMSIAQIANLNANTKKTEVEAQNMGAEGIGGQNIQADTEVKKATAEIQKVAARVSKDTEYNQVRHIVGAANEQMEKAREQFNKAQVAEETQRQQINKIRAEASGVLINNAAMRQGIKLDQAKITEITASIDQKWEELKVTREGQKISKENMERLTETMLWQAGINATGDLVKGLIDMRKGSGMQKKAQEFAREMKKGGKFENRTNYDKNGNVRSSTTTQSKNY